MEQILKSCVQHCDEVEIEQGCDPEYKYKVTKRYCQVAINTKLTTPKSVVQHTQIFYMEPKTYQCKTRPRGSPVDENNDKKASKKQHI